MNTQENNLQFHNYKLCKGFVSALIVTNYFILLFGKVLFLFSSPFWL